MTVTWYNIIIIITNKHNLDSDSISLHATLFTKKLY